VRAQLRSWLVPEPAGLAPVTEPDERRAIRIELVIVFAVTLGTAGLSSLLSLLDDLLQKVALDQQSVAVNQSRAQFGLLDLLQQLLEAGRLVAWGALGLYLLWRIGIRPAAIGLTRRIPARELAGGAALAAVIGIPGLGLYLLAYHNHASLAVFPSTLGSSWWRPIALTALAIANAFAEEVLVVGYLITRLRQFGVRENNSLVSAAVLRGSYHLYQGFGGFVGNLAMGLVFGRIWQRTNKLWPLVVAHSLLDIVAFVGYSLLRGHVSWLP
jgi:membrane protease YdiL (CAAX protease family)